MSLSVYYAVPVCFVTGELQQTKRQYHGMKKCETAFRPGMLLVSEPSLPAISPVRKRRGDSTSCMTLVLWHLRYANSKLLF